MRLLLGQVLAVILLTLSATGYAADQSQRLFGEVQGTYKKDGKSEFKNKLPEKTRQKFAALIGKHVAQAHLRSLGFAQGLGETITIALGENQEITARRRKSEGTAQGSVVWVGEVSHHQNISGLTHAKGQVVLVMRNNAITGSIRLGNKSYIIRPVNGSLHAVLEVDETALPPDHEDTIPGTSSDTSSSNAVGSTNSSASDYTASNVIKILVAYTPAVAAKTSDIVALADLAIAETNLSISNSNISNLSVQLALLTPVNYTELSGTNAYSNMLADVQGKTDGKMDALHALREDAQADVVTLLVDQPDACGIAYLNGAYAKGFSVVNSSCATGYYSFAHELGHIHGALHDPANNTSTTTPFTYGHGYQSPDNLFRTIMAYNCAATSCPRVPYWSSPDLIYNGEPMGTAAEADNARVMRETSDRLANLFENRNAGTQKWFVSSSSAVYGTPLLDLDGTIYFAARNALVYAVNPDGSIKWTYTAPVGVTGALAMRNGRLYFQTYGGSPSYLFALDKTTGSVLWSYQQSGGATTPAIGPDGTVYAMSDALRAFNPVTGAVKWTRYIYSTVGAGPSIAANGNLYQPAGTSKELSAINPANGVDLWKVALDSSTRTQVALDELNNSYALTENGTVYSINSTGGINWSYATGVASNFTNSLVLDGNKNVLFCTSDGKLFSLTNTGVLNWQTQLGTSCDSTPTIVRNNAVLIASAGQIYEFAVDGTLRWKASSPAMGASAITPGNDGTLYYGYGNSVVGGLYALDGGDISPATSAWPMKHHDVHHSGRFGYLAQANNPAVITISNPVNGAEVSIDSGALALSATAIDPEDGDISNKLVWTSNRDGALTSPAALSVGTHQITASVQDSGELVSSATTTVTITPHQNQPLTLTISSPVNGADYSPSQPIMLSATAVDQEDGDLSSTVTWASESQSSLLSPASFTLGDHVITATATDSQGLTQTSSVTIHVVNTQPFISINSPLEGASYNVDANPIAFQISANDQEDGNLLTSVKLTSNIDGVLTNPAVLSVGAHVITATVTDSAGAQSSATLSLAIEPHVNIPPTISISQPLSGQIFTQDQAVALLATATDSEDGNLGGAITWNSSINGVITSPASLAVGNHTLTATVTDSANASVSQSVAITVDPIKKGNLVTDGSVQSFTPANPGQIVSYEFSGVAGQSYNLLISNDTFVGTTQINVYKPDRTLLSTSTISYSSGNGTSTTVSLANLSSSGTYRVEIKPASTINSGSIDLALQIVDLSGSVTVNGASTSISLQPNQNIALNFTGTAGQSLGLGLTGLSMTPTDSAAYVAVSIYKPDGVLLINCGSMYANATGGSCDVPSLPVTGSYKVVVDPTSSYATTVNLLLNSAITSTLTANAATATSFSTSLVGQNALFSFSGTAANNYSLLINADTFAGNTTISVLKPDGTLLANTVLNYSGGSGTSGTLDLLNLPSSGTYSIFISPAGMATGGLNVSLKQDATGSLTVGGSSPSVNLSAGQNATYSFTGSVGQTLGLGVSSLAMTPSDGIGAVNVAIYKPDGSLLVNCGTTFGSQGGNSCDLPKLTVAGSYKVRVDPQSTYTTQFGLTLSADITGTLTANAAATTFTTSRVGQNARYSFSGTSGKAYTLKITSDTFVGATSISVLKPDGTQLTSGSVTYVSGTGASGSLSLGTLTTTGTYSVFISPPGKATGSLKVQLTNP